MAGTNKPPVGFDESSPMWAEWRNRIGQPKIFEFNPVIIARLPITPKLGMMATIIDGDAGLVGGDTLVGGGSTPYLVWYNGSDWTVIGI